MTSERTEALQDWAEAATVVREAALANVLVYLLLADIERKRSLLQQ